MTQPLPADLTTRRRARRVADWLARVRTRVPERRETVRHANGWVWRQDQALLAVVLAAKVERDLADG